MRAPIATPRLTAGDTPQTGATTTRLVRRHRGHRVCRAPLKFGRRAEMRLNPLGASRKRRQKGDGGTFPGFLSDHRTRRKRLRSWRRSRVRHFQLIPRTSRQPRVVQEVRVPMHRETENLADMRDFGLQDGETRTRTGDTTSFSRVELFLSRTCLQEFSPRSGCLAASAFPALYGRLPCETAHGGVRGPFVATVGTLAQTGRLAVGVVGPLAPVACPARHPRRGAGDLRPPQSVRVGRRLGYVRHIEAAAAVHARRVVTAVLRDGSVLDLEYMCAGIAAVAALSGRRAAAARLWGVVERLDNDADRKMDHDDRARFERALQRARRNRAARRPCLRRRAGHRAPADGHRRAQAIAGYTALPIGAQRSPV